MTFHSDYYTYGFKVDEISALLSKHQIHIHGNDSGVTQPVRIPGWAIKFRGLKSFTLDAVAEIMAGADPSHSGFLSDDGQSEFFVAMQLLEQAIEDGTLQTGQDIHGKTTVFDSQIRTWCRSIGREWYIPAVDPMLEATIDAAPLQSWQEVQREKIELLQQLGVLQSQHDDRESLKLKISALTEDVLHLLGEKAALQLQPKTESVPISPWPWGNHHTELLGHLEAAASEFWLIYKPHKAKATAPKNETVIAWLMARNVLGQKRKVSGQMAKAIATMLRPDDLPTGPRR